MIILASVLLFSRLIFASDDEYRLLQDLRKEYDAVERPVWDHEKAIDVKLRVFLQQILEIDEKNQLLTAVIWMHFTWDDYKMKWSPAEYGNITRVFLPHDMLWRPDILLFNSADENFDSRFNVNFVVNYNGNVLHAPPAIVKSSCTIDITWFPFDEQICFLKYGAWTYPGSLLNFFIDKEGLENKNNRIDLKYYVENGAWELVGTPAARNIYTYEGELYIELYFYMYLRRKVIYYGINWIIPSILFLLSNVLGFSLPSECGEKITLQTTNLLSVTVFLGMVAEVTPPTSTSVPFIGAFFALQMVLLGSSVIITILVINVSFRSPKTHKMSPFLRLVFLEWLPYLTLMSRPGKKFSKPRKSERPPTQFNEDSSTQSSTNTYKREPYGGIFHLIKGNSTTSLLRLKRLLGSHPIISSDQQALLQPLNEQTDFENRELFVGEQHTEQQPTKDLLRETLIQLSEYLRESKQQMIDEEEEEIEQADWRFMAMAIDRACMFVYAILSTFLPIFMYVATPKDKPSLYDENNNFIYV